MELEHFGAGRYAASLLKTLGLLWRFRGEVVCVQNPSMVLAFFAAILRPLLRYVLIVDRHSNFEAYDRSSRSFVHAILRGMSRFSIKRADLTIVTNTEIADAYIRGVGTPFVLPDPYPDTPAASGPAIRPDPDTLSVMFVSSWQTDEPIAEVMEACRRMGSRVRVSISGRVRPGYEALLRDAPANFVATGFLSDEEYFELMRSVDLVIAVSTRQGTLCCGAYEGVAMGKPVLVNNEQITKEHFSEGALYTDSTVEDFVRLFTIALQERDTLALDVRRFYQKSTERIRERIATLSRMIDELAAGRHTAP